MGKTHDTSFRFPDWKKIGWHIGKRLKDIFSPPPSGAEESEEERKARQAHDALKGFVYFENFEDLKSWSIGDVDPVQQANIPLLKRSELVQTHERPTSTVLLCHDYKGGYHDYESIRPDTLATEMYSCEYLQYVQTFIYFSHKLVCIPPPSWINVAHRNGVSILGTFIIEPQTPHIEQILQKEGDNYLVARQLASLCAAFGFDGWLLNFEKEFPHKTKDVAERIIGFITNLRQLIDSHGKVIWYDSLTVDNELDYQNTLTDKNIDYARPATALFTNYSWTEAGVREAVELTSKENFKSTRVYFGIDVWAQNTDMDGPPRTTFPPKGGGGTNTGLAMKTLTENNFSSAIFAPAWSFEHFSTWPIVQGKENSRTSIARSVDQAIWEGKALPDKLECDCRHGKPHHSVYYRSNPIINYAQEYPAGSRTFFQTRFQRAFRHLSVDGKDQTSIHEPVQSTLSYQDILPLLSPVECPVYNQTDDCIPRILYGEIGDTENACLQVKIAASDISSDECPGRPSRKGDNIQRTFDYTRLHLFTLDMQADGSLKADILYKRYAKELTASVGFYTAYQNGDSASLEYRYHDVLQTSQGNPCKQSFSIMSDDYLARMVGFGVYSSGFMKNTQRTALLDIMAVTIQAKSLPHLPFTIDHLRIVERIKGDCRAKRLAWDWQGSQPKGFEEIPWSPTTGPFAYFIIMLCGKELGRSYCSEFPLTDSDFQGNQQDGAGVSFQVDGVLFGSGTVSSAIVRVSMMDV